MFLTKKVYGMHSWSLEMSTAIGISACSIMKKTGREVERQRF